MAEEAISARKKRTGVDVRDNLIENRWKEVSFNGSSDDDNPCLCQMHSARGEINTPALAHNMT
jgi:hypothetical protein